MRCDAVMPCSLQAGAAGFSGISANFYPHLLSFLCRNGKGSKCLVVASRVQARSHRAPTAQCSHSCSTPLPPTPLSAPSQDFLSLAEATVCVAYVT